MPHNDPCWPQRLEIYRNALGELRAAVALRRERVLSRLKAMGLVQLLARLPEIPQALLFGSRARGSEHDGA